MKTPDNVAKQVLSGTRSPHPGCTPRDTLLPKLISDELRIDVVGKR